MKVRTLTEFSDLLDGEFAWRRKELTSVIQGVQGAPPLAKSTFVRAGVALLYAHWEGFVKVAAEAYLSLVSHQRLAYRELAPNLLALCFHGRIVSLQTTRGIAAHTDFASFVLVGLDSRADVPLGTLQTKGNLDSKRMQKIVHTLGLDFSPYELKQHVIDTQLLNWRNTIAHGQYLCPSESDFHTLYGQMTDLIRDFKDQLENAATLRKYRRI